MKKVAKKGGVVPTYTSSIHKTTKSKQQTKLAYKNRTKLTTIESIKEINIEGFSNSKDS